MLMPMMMKTSLYRSFPLFWAQTPPRLSSVSSRRFRVPLQPVVRCCGRNPCKRPVAIGARLCCRWIPVLRSPQSSRLSLPANQENRHLYHQCIWYCFYLNHHLFIYKLIHKLIYIYNDDYC